MDISCSNSPKQYISSFIGTNQQHAMLRYTTFVMLLCLVAICTAQLTFTPTWGKRGISQGSQVQNGQSEPGCKTSVDSLMLIYKLIQNEAQKLIECEK